MAADAEPKWEVFRFEGSLNVDIRPVEGQTVETIRAALTSDPQRAEVRWTEGQIVSLMNDAKMADIEVIEDTFFALAAKD
jgi:hypothetical protein